MIETISAVLELNIEHLNALIALSAIALAGFVVFVFWKKPGAGDKQ